MVTLLFGLVLVAISAAVFGFALFGHRPIPQPAMSLTGSHLVEPPAEAAPSIDVAPVGTAAAPLGGVLPAGRWRRLLQREPTADHQPAADVTLSTSVRVRSALLLTLIVTGLAAIIGIVASIVVVGVVLLVT